MLNVTSSLSLCFTLVETATNFIYAKQNKSAAIVTVGLVKTLGAVSQVNRLNVDISHVVCAQTCDGSLHPFRHDGINDENRRHLLWQNVRRLSKEILLGR